MIDAWVRCTEPLRSWSDLELQDMVFAYRKAKVDAFFERAVSTAEAFADYEEQLEANLRGLLHRLRTAKGRRGLAVDRELLGRRLLVAKKLHIDPKRRQAVGGTFIADERRAFDHVCTHHQLSAEFRVVAEFPVDMHVLSALWTNRVGHRFDACLGPNAYGSRVRRYGDDGTPSKRPYHLKANGTFPPYFHAYRAWRDCGMAAMWRELEAGEKIACITLDLRNYFHSIDPSFVTSREFQRTIGFDGSAALTEIDHELNELVCGLLGAWSADTRTYIDDRSSSEVPCGGLPIALTAARVLANVLLQPWDRAVAERLTPIHYGRYVDDMFLVLRDPGNISGIRGLMQHIRRHLRRSMLARARGKRDQWRIRLPDTGESMLELQASKCKVFLLEGRSGIDLLDVIQSEITDLASERRLMPEPESLTKKTSAQVLAGSNDVRERADTLRRADGLSIRRMAWAIQLRWAETLALDLPPDEWQAERRDLFRFARHHVLRAERLLDHIDYLPRLLGVAVACGDWDEASDLVEATKTALGRLQEACARSEGLRLNGYPVSSGPSAEAVWEEVRDGVMRAVRSGVLRAWPTLAGSNAESPTDEDGRIRLLAAITGRLPSDVDADAWESAQTAITKLARRDLARRPYKQLWAEDRWFDGEGTDATQSDPIADCFGDDVAKITEFVEWVRERAHLPRPHLHSLLFATRPLSSQEIAELDPRCVGLDSSKVDATAHWGDLTRSLRGTWTRAQRPAVTAAPGVDRNDDRTKVLCIGESPRTRGPILCISNFQTVSAAWHAAAAGRPLLTRERYVQFARFINHVAASRPRPDYVVLPELAVPRAWVKSIVNRFLGRGISVIAGVEYECYEERRVHNSAVLALVDDRLGFPASVLIWQHKSAAAPGEAEALQKYHGRSIVDTPPSPLVYSHHGFDFAVLICSELQDIRLRAACQGQVDCLIVPAWNQDLETFSALVLKQAIRE